MQICLAIHNRVLRLRLVAVSVYPFVLRENGQLLAGGLKVIPQRRQILMISLLILSATTL